MAINATTYDYQLYHGRDLEGVLEGGWSQRPEKHFVLLCEASAPARSGRLRHMSSLACR